MVNCEDGYSFHLSTDGSIYSDTGSVTSSYKARIDSLFRNRATPRQQTDLGSSTLRSLVTTVQVHSSAPSSNSSPSPPPLDLMSPKVTNVTSIRVPSPQAWKARSPSAREELESIFGGPDRRQRAFLNTRSAVQAQIERLFADASAEPVPLGGRAIAPKPPTFSSIPPPPPPPPPIAPLPALPPANPPLQLPSRSPLLDPSPCPSLGEDSSPAPSVSPLEQRSLSSASPSPIMPREVSVCRTVASMRYPIDYLGAIQLAEKAANLDVLQEPLKELYYKYRYSVSRGRIPIPGSLHITEKGIRILHGTRDTPGHYNLLNPFPTIAVWAAVKLVIRREVGEHGQMFFSYAFLPLICDPQAKDKYNLYHELNVGNPNVMAGDHPPMFACVMRKVGVPKVLECHGFVCRSAEDAIVIAANLYQSLLESMRAGHSSDSSGDTREEEDRHVMSDSEAVPVRPPRRKRIPKELVSLGSRRLQRSSSEDLLSSHRVGTENRLSKRRIKRSISDRHSLNTLDDFETYAKVQIPRSKSFVNVTCEYGFQDLLNDVKQQTGLNTVDDVLEQIISPNGMSFSEMDPKYRELVLKLALTLSKDEIYKRSKNILRKHKYRTTSIVSLIDSDSDASTISSVIKATKRSFSRLGSRASSLHLSSMPKEKAIPKKLSGSKSKLNITEPMNKIVENGLNMRDSQNQIMSSSGSPTKRIMPKTPMPKRVLRNVSDGYVSCSECGYESECSSKCYCSLPRTLTNQSRPSTLPTKKVFQKERDKYGSSDFPCECDTESCAESEKCYCSLKVMRKTGLKGIDNDIDSEDTDATVKSKDPRHCSFIRDGSESSESHQQRITSPYLTEHSKSRSAGTIFSISQDALRKRSYSTYLSSDSDSSDLRPEQLSRTSSRSRMSFLRQRSASTEFLSEKPARFRRHPSGSVGSGGSARDSPDSPAYERGSNSSRHSSAGSLLETMSHRSHSSCRSQQKILLLSAVDPSGKVVYRGASKQKSHSDRGGSSDTTSILSMKKTAEIAALFSELKLNQTTDLVNHLQTSTSESDDDTYSTRQANSSSFLFSDNIENSLGYLP